MNIISVDLPWNPGKKGRRAVVVADLDRNIKIMSAKDDDEMLALVRNNAEQESIVLLDIPIEGSEQKFRPVDRALARQGIWIQPSSSAGNRGKRLKELLKDKKGITVQEIYPYAVYKFLAYLKDRKLIGRLKPDRFEVLLDDSFRGFQPWKYKRERKKEERLKNMRYLYSLIMDTGTGLNYHIPLHYPDALSNLGQLSDEYDACLGAIVGIYFANNSRYACIAGDSNSGNILLLADRWLAEQLA